MNKEGLDIIQIDFDAPGIPPGVKDLQPLVYRDGGAICVMEGQTPMDGIFGCGCTQEEALKDFQKHYEEAKQNSF